MYNNHNNQSVLVVDDSPITSQYLKKQLAAHDIRVHFADTADAASEQIKTNSDSRDDLCLLVLGAEMSATDGSAVLATLRQLRPQCPWISQINCDMSAAEMQTLLVARLQDQPLAVVAADNQTMLLAQIQSRLRQSHDHAQITTLQTQLQNIQQRFEHLLDTSSEAIAFVVSGCHLYANPSFLELTGMDSLEQLERHSLLELLEAEGDDNSIRKCLNEVEHSESESLEISARLISNNSKTPLPVTARLQRARYGGEVCVQVTVSEKPAVAAPAIDQSLPGFLPKHAFYELAAQSLETSDSEEPAHAVLCVRLDNFNEIQEQIGLVNSELLVEERAELLHQCIDDEHDLITHYSEKLFLVKVTRAKRPAIEQLCKHIVTSFSSCLAEIAEHSMPLTCSIGYAMAGRQNRDINTLILEAARAARQVEQAGGNSSLRYRPNLRSVNDDDGSSQWQERLRHALDNSELLLTVDRISNIGEDDTDLISVDVCLYDAESDTHIHSAAWRHAIQGSGLRAELDRQMVRLIMQKPELLEKTVFVPICASEHDGKVLADWLQASYKHVDYHGDGLVFMLDSTDLANNMQPAVMLKRALANLPVRWGLDLFGATDNAEQLLHHLQMEYSRLCPSVLPKDSGDKQAIDKLTKLASAGQHNKAQIIACSVDSAAVVPTLWQAGIKLIQGEFIQQRPEIMQA